MKMGFKPLEFEGIRNPLKRVTSRITGEEAFE